MTNMNDASKGNKNVPVCLLHRCPCFNCGENNHSQNQSRNNARVECYLYHSLGHKARRCC